MDSTTSIPDVVGLLDSAPPSVVAPRGIVGGRVTTRSSAWPPAPLRIPLVTRDARALGTYAALGTEIQLVNG